MRSRANILIAAGIGILAVALYGCERNDPTSPDDAEIIVTASPSTVFFGSGSTATSRITATVVDADGRPVSGVGVRFTTTFGTLRSDGVSVRTDSNGVANDTLTLADDDDDATVTARSGSKTGTADVTVGGANEPPIAKPTISATTVKVNQNVTFDGTTSTDPQGNNTIVRWKWTLVSTFPSGPPETDEDHDGSRATASLFNTSFDRARTVAVQLSVFDDQGAVSLPATVSGGLTVVANFKPTATITGGNLAKQVFETFILSAAGSRDDPRDAPGGAIVRYDWDMGDGTLYPNNTVPTQDHFYQSTGTFTVRLTVWDNGDGDPVGCDSGTHLCRFSESADTTITVTVTP